MANLFGSKLQNLTILVNQSTAFSGIPTILPSPRPIFHHLGEQGASSGAETWGKILGADILIASRLAVSHKCP